MRYRAILADEDELRERKSFVLTPGMKRAIFWAAFFVFFNLLAVLYCLLSRDIYYWDNAIGWNMAKEIAHGEVYPLFGGIYDSIINQSQNYLPSLIPALFAKLFGDTYIVFILSIVNCYLIPSYALLLYIIKKIGKAPAVTAVLVFMTLPFVLFLAFNGFTEIGALVPGLGCYALYFGKKKSLSWQKSIAVGALLALMTLWNTWYIFFAVSFITAMAADCILLKKKWYPPVIVLAVMAVLLARLFGGFTFKQLVGAYGKGSFDFAALDNFHVLTRYFGLAFLLMSAASSVALAVKTKERRMIFPWIQALLCYVVFSSTKLHSQGHMLMYFPAASLIMILCIRAIKKEWMLAAAGLLALCQTVNIFLPYSQPNGVSEIKHAAIFDKFSMRPVRRDGVDEILAFKARLDERIPDGEFLGVLSYSDAMNADMLRNAELSLNKKNARVSYIARTIPYFDGEDISPLCNANYILTASPLQAISPNQMILETALESFELYCDIALAYEEQFDFETIINGVTYKLYRRVRDVTPTERAEFELRYNRYLNN